VEERIENINLNAETCIPMKTQRRGGGRILWFPAEGDKRTLIEEIGDL